MALRYTKTLVKRHRFCGPATGIEGQGGQLESHRVAPGGPRRPRDVQKPSQILCPESFATVLPVFANLRMPRTKTIFDALSPSKVRQKSVKKPSQKTVAKKVS